MEHVTYNFKKINKPDTRTFQIIPPPLEMDGNLASFMELVLRCVPLVKKVFWMVLVSSGGSTILD